MGGFSTALLILSLLLYPLTLIAVNFYAPELKNVNYITGTDPVSDAARILSYVALPAALIIKSVIAVRETTSLVLILTAVLCIPLLGEYFTIVNDLLR